MFLRDWFDEAKAQVDPFDGGQTAATVKTAKKTPAQLPTRSTQQVFVPSRDPNKAWITQPINHPTPKIDNSFGTNLKKVATQQALGATRSLTGAVQGISGLVDLASPGTGTSRVSKKLDNFAKFTDDTANNEADMATSSPEARRALRAGYHGQQGATDVLTFAAGDAAARGIGEAAANGSKIVRQTTKLVNPVNNAIDKAAGALDEGNAAQRVAATAVRTLRPSSLVNVAGNTALDVGAQSSKGRDVSPESVALDAAGNLVMNTAIPVAGKVIKESADAVKPFVRPAVDATADAIQHGARAAGDYIHDLGTSAFNIKPHRGISDDLVEAADRVRTAQDMNNGMDIHPDDLSKFHQLHDILGTSVNDPTRVDNIIRDRRVWAEEGRARINEEQNAIAKAQASSEGGYVAIPGAGHNPADELPDIQASRAMANGKPSVRGNSNAVYNTDNANLEQIARSALIAAKGTAGTAADHDNALRQIGFDSSDIQAVRNFVVQNADENGTVNSNDLRQFIQDRLHKNDVAPPDPAMPEQAAAPQPATAPVPPPEGDPVPIQQVLQDRQAILGQNGGTIPPPDVPTGPEPAAPRPGVAPNRLTERGQNGEQNLADEVKQNIQGEHNVRNTEQLDENSRADINNLDDNTAIDEAYKRLNVEQGKIDDQTVAFANQAIQRAQLAGRMEDAVNIHDMLSEHLVKNGQTIQAASLLYRMSPEFLFYKARRDLIKSGTEMTSELEAKLQQQAGNIAASGKAAADDALHRQAETIVDSQGGRKLPPDQRQQAIEDLVNNPTDEMKGEAQQAGKQAQDRAKAVFGKTVADSTKKGAGAKLISIWKAGLLSGQRTFQGNLISNATFAGLKKAADLPAAAADKYIGIFTGKRTKVATSRGEFSGAVEGTKKGWNTLRTGIDERNVNDKTGKFEGNGELNFKNPVINTLFGKTTNTVFRTLSSADQPFYYSAAKNSLYDQAIAAAKTQGVRGADRKAFVQNLVANPTKEMAQTAKNEADKAVLGYDTIGSKAIQGIHNTIEHLPGEFSNAAKATAHHVVDVLAPFVKVPTAFISRTIDFTPAGPFKTAIGQISRKQFDQRALSQAIGEGITGTGVIALGIALAHAGHLSGDYPKGDPKEAQRWKAEGITPNSVKLGDKWVSLNYLGPVGLLFNAGKQMVEGGEGAASKVASAAAGLGQGLMGQSFLQGFSGFSDAIQDPERNAKSFVNSQASSVIPAWMNDVANVTDKYQRQADTVLESVKNRIPGLREDNKIKEDVYGNKLEQAAGQGNTINGFKPSQSMADKSPAIAEVNRLHDIDPNNKDLQVTPTGIEKKLTIEGKPVNLSNDQKYELQEKVGQATQDGWNKLIATPEYKALSDADKAKALVGLRQASQELETRDYVESKGLASYSKSLSGNARSLKDTGDVTRFVRAADDNGQPNYADKYENAKTEYDDQKDKWTPVQRAKKEHDLRQLAVQKDFDADTVNLYGMSKADVYALVSTDPNGKKLVNDMIEYGDKLHAAGLGDNKFRTSKGAISIRPKTSGSGSGDSASAYSLYSGKNSRLNFDKSLRSLLDHAHLA